MHAPDGLAPEIAAAGIVVTAGGVALLESCVLGRPVVALALAANQRQAVFGLERDGAVVVATPESAADAVVALVKDLSRRVAIAAAARASVNGDGASRVVDMLEQLVAAGELPAMSRRRSTLCVVQARTGSTRLPGKVLQDLGGRPLLRFMLDRLADLRVDDVVIATSTLDRDDAVVEIAFDAGRQVVRGSELDVLDRFAGALLTHPADHVVRLTADCPLADPVLVESVLARHLDRGADYTSNVFPRTFPRGLDCEVMTADALRAADAEAIDPAEREHVTPFLYRRPERFALGKHAQRRGTRA